MSLKNIEQQIKLLDEDIYIMEASPSGVLDYVGFRTFGDYEEVWAVSLRDMDERISEINEDIIEASGRLRVLKNAITFHRH